MPVISRILRHCDTDALHPPFAAHFHAIYDKSELLVGISPLRIIQGDAAARMRSMVIEWAAQYQSELIEAWNRFRMAQRPKPIEPLQ